MRRLATPLLGCLVLTACEAVPEVDFLADASVPDGGPRDSASDAYDAALDAGTNCPDATPEGVTMCCGVVPCIGECSGTLANGRPACEGCTGCSLCCAKLSGGGAQPHVSASCANGTTCP
jgi:hypothetical protein